MKKLSAEEKKRIKELTTKIKELETQLVKTKKVEGIDPYVEVKVRKNQGRFERVKKKGAEDKAFGHFFLRVDVLAEEADIFIPLSIATGKNVAGMMYQIEGTDTASPERASLEVRGEGVSQVTIGTLVFAKVPKGSTGSFEVRVLIRGSFGKTYTLVFTRLNYKLQLSDARYQQYLKEIRSETVKFS
jgi:hypothetical protein